MAVFRNGRLNVFTVFELSLSLSESPCRHREPDVAILYVKKGTQEIVSLYSQ